MPSVFVSTTVACLVLASPVLAQTDRAAEQADRVSDRVAAPEVEVVLDVVYATIDNGDGQSRDLLMDVATPVAEAGDRRLPAVVYIHGGGWANGQKEDGHLLLRPLAAGGYVSATIQYRLTGEATYPAAVHDCKAAIRFLRANADDLGIDPTRIGVYGHSAGGHLAALLATTSNTDRLDGAVGESGVSSAITCAVPVSAPTDLSVIGRHGRGMVGEWIGGVREDFAKRAREASPVAHVDAEDPPCLLVHGTKDRLVNIDQAERLHDAMTTAGADVELYRVEGAGHAIRDRDAYIAIAAFFDEHLGGAAAERLRQMGTDRPLRDRPNRQRDR